MTNTTQNTNYLTNKAGRIYIARNGQITVFCLDNGEKWFCNNLMLAQTIHRGPVDGYWMNSIDFAGSFSDYFTFGMVYDEVDRPHYPAADPIVAMTEKQIEKLRK